MQGLQILMHKLYTIKIKFHLSMYDLLRNINQYKHNLNRPLTVEYPEYESEIPIKNIAR